MTVKKYVLTFCGENPPSLDDVHEAVAKTTKDYFSTGEQATNQFRIRKKVE